MALSNWDTLAVDLEGNSINGGFTSPCGVKVEFYKNWIYIYDEQAWRRDSGWSPPCVAQIQYGDIHYLDITIKAIRGPQQGVFAVVTSGYSDSLKGMVGCGVYGYDDSEWVGVTDESRKFLQDYISRGYVKTREEIIDDLKHHHIYMYFPGKPDVKTNQYEDAIANGDLERSIEIWGAPEFKFEEKIRKVSLDGALRFNQGDACFAEHLGAEIPATETGKAQPTIMSGIIEKMKKSS